MQVGETIDFDHQWLDAAGAAQSLVGATLLQTVIVAPNGAVSTVVAANSGTPTDGHQLSNFTTSQAGRHSFQHHAVLSNARHRWSEPAFFEVVANIV